MLTFNAGKDDFPWLLSLDTDSALWSAVVLMVIFSLNGIVSVITAISFSSEWLNVPALSHGVTVYKMQAIVNFLKSLKQI